MIEHTPDLIAFLEAAAVLLKSDGVVVLAVPDKRYCFDYFQPLTTTGQLLAAHAEEKEKRGTGQILKSKIETIGGNREWREDNGSLLVNCRKG